MSARDAMVADRLSLDHCPTCPTCADIAPFGATVCHCGRSLFPPLVKYRPKRKEATA